MARDARRDGRTTAWRARPAWAALAALLAAACTLDEVGTGPGADVLVVESVLRAERARHPLLLHHAVNGRVVQGEPGAEVAVTTPGGRAIRFEEARLEECMDRFSTLRPDSLRVTPTCYLPVERDLAVASGHPSGEVVRPGGTYELRVTTRDGRRLRGRTTVPASFVILAPRSTDTTAGATCSLPPETNLPLVWSSSRGAWSYLSSIQVHGLRAPLRRAGIDAPDVLDLSGLAISERDTTLLVPANFGLFELGDVEPAILTYLQRGFPAGVTVHLVVAAVDRNYVNGVRGGSFNPSGRVRLSSVVGDGVGVFGSLVERRLTIHVGSGLPFPPCLGR